MTERPLLPEPEFLAYLIRVAEGEPNTSYALGRMREAVAMRVNRLPMASEESAFLRRLLGLCQANGGGAANSPEAISLMGGKLDGSAVHIGSVVGLIRHRIFAATTRAA